MTYAFASHTNEQGLIPEDQFFEMPGKGSHESYESDTSALLAEDAPRCASV